MVLALLRAIHFFWTATRGFRLRPWRSPYLRWRIETYSGIPASSLRLRDFWHIFAGDPRQFCRFFLWSSDLQTLAHAQDAKK
jgi:hypothetical protein